MLSQTAPRQSIVSGRVKQNAQGTVDTVPISMRRGCDEMRCNLRSLSATALLRLWHDGGSIPASRRWKYFFFSFLLLELVAYRGYYQRACCAKTWPSLSICHVTPKKRHAIPSSSSSPQHAHEQAQASERANPAPM